MKSYKKLASEDKRFVTNTRKRLINERGSVCAGCGKKTWAPNLDVYVIDDEKPPDDKNLILLDKSCRDSIVRLSHCLNYAVSDGDSDWHRQVYGGRRS